MNEGPDNSASLTQNAAGKNQLTNRAKPQKDEAYERIYKDIITFQLKPGEHISERVLLQKYNIGQAAVRTALLRLEQEGLIANKGRKGHQIIPITLESIRNVLELRLILEPAAAEMAAGRVDAKRLTKLKRLADVDLSKSNWKVNLKYLEANRDFHVAVAEYSGNRQLAVWIKHLHNLSFRTFYLLENSGIKIRDGQISHQAILDELLTENGKEASRLTLMHLQEARDNTLAAVLNLPELQQLSITAL